MTVQEMHTAFKIGLDKVDSLNYPNFTTSEIDLFLNQSQERFVKQRYGFNNRKFKPFESNQKRTDDLRSLVRNSVLSFNSYDSANNINSEARFVDLPNDYMFAINEQCKISFLDCNSNTEEKIVPVIVEDHDNVSIVINSPFEKPNKNKVIRVMYQDKVEVIKSSDTNILEYLLRYIKRPRDVDFNLLVDSELAEHTHSEIVNDAISIALESIESQRANSFVVVNKNNEE